MSEVVEKILIRRNRTEALVLEYCRYLDEAGLDDVLHFVEAIYHERNNIEQDELYESESELTLDTVWMKRLTKIRYAVKALYASLEEKKP